MRLIWSFRSQRELFDIAAYYDQFDPVLAEAIVERVETAVQPLRDYPRLGAVADADGARKWHVPDTPFVLLYDILPNAIAVLSVRHGRSDWRPTP